MQRTDRRCCLFRADGLIDRHCEESPAGITTGGAAGGGAGWLWALFAAGAPADGELAADELPAGAFAAGAPLGLLELELGFDLLHPPAASRTPIASHRTAVPVLILHLSLPSEMNCGEVWTTALGYSNSGGKLAQRFAAAGPLTTLALRAVAMAEVMTARAGLSPSTVPSRPAAGRIRQQVAQKERQVRGPLR